MKSNPLDPICDGSPIRTRKCSTVLWHLNCCYATKLGVRPVQDGGRISRRPAANRVSSLYMISMVLATRESTRCGLPWWCALCLPQTLPSCACGKTLKFACAFVSPDNSGMFSYKRWQCVIMIVKTCEYTFPMCLKANSLFTVVNWVESSRWKYR